MSHGESPSPDSSWQTIAVAKRNSPTTRATDRETMPPRTRGGTCTRETLLGKRPTGVEPVIRAWKALVLPLHHGRARATSVARVHPYRFSWDADALVLMPAFAAAYLMACTRFPAPPWRNVCFLSGCGLMLAVQIGPLDTLALHYLLTMHLLQNVVLAEWGPLLCVLGLDPADDGRARADPGRPRPHPPARRPPPLARHLLRVASAVGVRRRAPAPVDDPPPRARLLLRGRLPPLVARLPRPAVERRKGALRLRRLRPRQPARAPARAAPERRLRLLRQARGSGASRRSPTSRSPA